MIKAGKTSMLLMLLIPALPGLGLSGCGQEATPTPAAVVTLSPEITAIPTFTPAPGTLQSPGTPSPTPIVVAPTVTSAPTAAPTATGIPAPTFNPTPLPPSTPRPVTESNNPYREISPATARQLEGYTVRLPVYLPQNYTLRRISYTELSGQASISLVSEYANLQNELFFITAQLTSRRVPTPTVTGAPQLSPLPPLGSPVLPTAPVGAAFRQEMVTVRGQTALLSYSDVQSSLSWSEPQARYFINGALSRAEILRVAESLQ